jgi:hypothetical protein
MSRINGEKARANIAKKNRTARREKDRARLAEIRATAGKQDSGEKKTDDAEASS